MSFARSIGRAGAPLHAAAHSHHPWPDVTADAQMMAWEDAARLLDGKWDHIFGAVIPAAQRHIARLLQTPDPSDTVFAPNTHSLVLRLISCLPVSRPIRVLTTGSEFLSLSRQLARLEEDGLACITRIATEPFDSFPARFAQAATEGRYDLVYLSHVFFDSGWRVPDLAVIVRAVRDPQTFIAIDGYHSFMAVPLDLSALADRVFFIAGGYKYAMAGEGVCFMHCPKTYGKRPRDTGWYAGFSGLQGGGAAVGYADSGARFSGATFDPSGLYRFNAVQDWLNAEGLTVTAMLQTVRGHERALLDRLPSQGGVTRADLVVAGEAQRGRFLAFRTRKAGAIVAALSRANIIADSRGDRLRVGLGIYHNTADIARLADSLNDAAIHGAAEG